MPVAAVPSTVMGLVYRFQVIVFPVRLITTCNIGLFTRLWPMNQGMLKVGKGKLGRPLDSPESNCFVKTISPCILYVELFGALGLKVKTAPLATPVMM